MKVKVLILNPFTLWIKFLINLIYNKSKNRNKRLSIDYMTFCNSTNFGDYVTISRYCNINESSISDFTYISENTNINNTFIGKYCSISSNVKIGLGIHPSSIFVSTHPIFYSIRKQSQISFVDESLFNETLPVTIGNDVWIGANVVILDGIVIGDGAIISAGAIVNKDVAAYSIYGGVPAKLIKYRFDEGEIIYLQNLKWWDKDLTWLKKNAQYFKDIKELISKQIIVKDDN